MPSLLFIVLFFLTPKTVTQVLPNQKQNVPAPSGNYILSVPIEKSAINSEIDRVWKVTIPNAGNDIEYKDEESVFWSRFNVYWCWDDDNRVWLYNSDDQRIYFWEKESGAWTKYQWGFGHQRQIYRDIFPPETLYPDYAKGISEDILEI